MSDIIVITPSDLDEDTIKVVGSKVVATSATDVQKGVVTLAVEANFPSTSDAEATTPAYIKKVIDAIPSVPVATDTVQGIVSLAVNANYPSTSDSEAVTPAYLNAYALIVASQIANLQTAIDELSLDIFE